MTSRSGTTEQRTPSAQMVRRDGPATATPPTATAAIACEKTEGISRFERRLAPGAAGVARRRRQYRAAVHHERVARDVAREVREQEPHGVPDVPSGPFDPERGGLAPLVAGRRAHAPLIDHRRVDGTRRNAVDADALGSVVD